MSEANRCPTKSDPDAELLRAARSDPRAVFPELVRRYERALYNFGMKMCGVAGDAEDLVQDTFLNVFRYLDGFRNETKFKNWIYRIAASICIKKRRKSKYAPERELSLDEFLPADEAAVEQAVPSWAALPLDRVLNNELRHRLEAAILELPDKYRVVLVLRDIEGFSTEESGQILNLTPANVKVRLHRARLFLRDRLKSYYDDE
ncbi:RNA polymerase sigma factor [Desulfatitalea alkaliphila]|uniref:Sigma-70 family RNA polymerase sigma factor n=1 Tax=Desulfatitalea alkaliphila TaxID=2929485 RepID=A0AA41R360_9BACT|nr:sigma-70 family RNA polymerase sigma factor [Desulfatitalea alkaliphila]MCJ8500230.1 sigma-70 family RNA polymerase sigma factor [Desulfatitalea alkaliphila]